MKIDFEKIITQAITAVVVGVFYGACLIVWRGATTVGDRVSQSEQKILRIMEVTSDQLAQFQSETNEKFLKLSEQLELKSELLNKSNNKSNKSNILSGNFSIFETFSTFNSDREDESVNIEPMEDRFNFSTDQKILKQEIINKYKGVD